MTDLTGKTVAFLVATEGIEQVELTEPWRAITDAGGTAKLLSTGNWVDEEVCVDGNLITSRKPDDLKAFCQTLVDAVAAGTVRQTDGV
jgi:putative intracellular protease/amidase